MMMPNECVMSHYEYCLPEIKDVMKAENAPFKKDSDLEKNASTNASSCLRDFLDKGGTFHHYSPEKNGESKFQILPQQAVYPACSGGFCRSQVLWALLLPFSDQITLFPPHAARHGWDPYNGQINRYRNASQENVPDDFEVFFNHKKAERFGFSQESEWQKHSVNEQIPLILNYYSEHYFGPSKQEGQERVYIAFSNNVHTVLYRLTQANERLDRVTVWSIDLEDLVTFPPVELNTRSRSPEAYAYFYQLLTSIVDTSSLEK